MLKNLNQISPLSDNVQSFLLELSKNRKVDRLIVFGSRVFGDYEKYSDLDLAVDAPRIEKIEWLKLKEYAIYDLEVLIRVSMVFYSSNPINLKTRINKAGKIIYERQ